MSAPPVDAAGSTAAAAPRPTQRPALRRPVRGRAVGGVAAGVADHLGVPVARVRVGFLLATLALGAGAIAYLFLLLTVPARTADGDAAPPRLARLVPRLRDPAQPGRTGNVLLAAALVVVAVLLISLRADLGLDTTWALPVAVVLCGAALAWSQLTVLDPSSSSPRHRATVVVRVGGGTLLATVGVVLLVGQGQSFPQVVRGVVAGLAILAGVAVVLAPLGLRLWRDLLAERAARVRESERADIAAHLHDSVLQTLSLIRSRSGDPAAVQQLARAQERELREWLYTDRVPRADSLAQLVRDVAAEVEERHGVPVDVVTTGDRVPDAGSAVLAGATREALTNAVVHGRAPVSLFLEVGPGSAEVFVKDRGEGFDVERVLDGAGDRHGVRESILGRMRRHGGTAAVRSDAARGTEVHLSMPALGVGDDERTGA